MRRWISAKNEFGESPEVDKFISDIVAVCAKHGMWLSHEDLHGAFKVVEETTADWLFDADDSRNKR